MTKLPELESAIKDGGWCAAVQLGCRSIICDPKNQAPETSPHLTAWLDKRGKLKITEHWMPNNQGSYTLALMQDANRRWLSWLQESAQ